MPRETLKILHVEDDPLYASMMQVILGDEPGLQEYDIIHVDSLKKALQELKYSSFKVVLLDLSLGDVSGLDNVRAIKNENPDLPIIVLTGMDNEAIALKALDEGAQDFIVKGYANNKMMRFAIQSSIKRKGVERDLFHRANYDELIGLANRRHFMLHLEREIDIAKRWKRNVTLLFIDLDRFKIINDMFGHEAGNAVIQEVSRRLKNTLRATDLIARYGGDEFVVMLDHNDSELSVSKYACASIITKLQDSLNSAVVWQDKKIEFTASIGVAVFPDTGSDAASLMQNADMAMYEAKKQGGRHFRFAISRAS